VIAVAASVVTGKPVKWIEDRMENLQADSFARDYHMDAELAANKDGKITALRIKTVADHGYADAAANPSKFPAGLFSVVTGSYDIKDAFVEVDGAYTNKAPGGIAYRCSFRVTEAAHAIERMTDMLAQELKTDPAEFRLKNFIPADKFPYKSALGWEYDSGNYQGALKKAMDQVGYAACARSRRRSARRASSWGSASRASPRSWARDPRSTSTSSASRCSTPASCACTPRARPSRASAPSRRARVTRRRTRRSSRRSWASPPPTSRWRRATRTPRPTAWAPTPAARRRWPRPRPRWPRARCETRRARSRPTCWRSARRTSSGSREVLGQGRAREEQDDPGDRARRLHQPSAGHGGGLEAVNYYDPPNLTFPFGSYICVVDIDRGTGEVKIRRFVAIDDCGNIINPMIVQGQVHGGLTMGMAPALMEEISYDEAGNIQGGSFMDYLVPRRWRRRSGRRGTRSTPSPHHPLGAKGVGESATVGAPPAIANAVVDALAHLGVRHIDIPITPEKVWRILRDKGVAE
jgi:carbon-monoxide dehydrogenase large subunit